MVVRVLVWLSTNRSIAVQVLMAARLPASQQNIRRCSRVNVLRLTATRMMINLAHLPAQPGVIISSRSVLDSGYGLVSWRIRTIILYNEFLKAN